MMNIMMEGIWGSDEDWVGGGGLTPSDMTWKCGCGIGRERTESGEGFGIV